MLRLPGGVAQGVVELFQGGDQDFPELVQNLRLAVIAPVIQLPGQAGKALFQIDLQQKVIKRQNLSPQITAGSDCVPETLQRADGPFPVLIDPLKLGPVGIVPLGAEALGMVFPVLRPLTAPDTPDNGIILHPVTGIQRQRRQTGAQIAQHRALLKAA